MCIFIFDPKQIDKNLNKYHNDKCIQFMVESLEDLNKQLNGQIQFYLGDNVSVLTEINKVNPISLIIEN